MIERATAIPSIPSRQPLLWLATSLSAGIVCAKWVSTPSVFALAIVCAAAASFALAYRGRAIGSALIFIAFAAAGAASLRNEASGIRADRLRVLYDSGAIDSGAPVEIEGILTAAPEPTVDGYLLTVRSNKLWHRNDERSVSGNVRIYTRDPQFQISHLKYGSLIRVACRLEREDRFLNPGAIPSRELLDRIGVDATGAVKSALLIEHIADESVFLPLAWVYEQRAKLITAFREGLSPRAAGVMIASLLGNRNFLDKDTADLFREGGTFHILVISGLHITFIGGLIYWLLRRITRKRALQFIVANSILWGYTLAVGADIPVVRAAIMFTILSFSYVIYRESSLLNSLGACAVVLLVWRPSELFNPSFQLTFVSVAAIVACAYPLLKALRAIGEWTPSADTPFPPNVPGSLRRFCETVYWSDAAWKINAKREIWTANLFKSPIVPPKFSEGIRTVTVYLFEGLVASLIVQLWMLPLTVVYFHRVSIISIGLNLWVGFFIALESFAAVAGAIAAYLSEPLAAGFFAIAEVLNWVMLALPRLFAEIGWLSFRLPAYGNTGQVVYFLYFIPIALLTIGLTRWNPFGLKPRSGFLRARTLAFGGAVFVILAAFVVHGPWSAARADGRLLFNFLDVGHGDAILVTFPNGKTMLVDGGGRLNYKDDENDGEPFDADVAAVGEAVVSQFLWERGHSHIDHLVATHAHSDHTGGLADVAKNFTIGSAIVGRPSENDSESVPLADAVRLRGIPIETVSRGDVLTFGDVTVEVLYPPANSASLAPNDNSIVLRIVYGSRAILLTGDIEQSAEIQLALGTFLVADVVKVPHHGSRTSSTGQFVDAVKPQYAVISAPRRSPFGHPHAAVVERWKLSGAKVLTTGSSGMITISTDGKDLVVSEFAK